MLKDVSSPLTFFNKFIKPYVFLGIVIYASYKFNFTLYSNPVAAIISLTLILLVLFFVVIPPMRVKKVAYDEQYLYISNYFKEIQVPLTDVVNISQSFWQRARSREVSEGVTIIFKQPTVFGTRILFNPSVRFFSVGEHPVVNELKRALENHRRNSPQQYSRPN